MDDNRFLAIRTGFIIIRESRCNCRGSENLESLRSLLTSRRLICSSRENERIVFIFKIEDYQNSILRCNIRIDSGEMS